MAKSYLWYKVKVSEFISRNIARSLVSSGIGQSRLHHQAIISSPCLYVEMLLSHDLVLQNLLLSIATLY
jgi:hypothetical protein